MYLRVLKIVISKELVSQVIISTNINFQNDGPENEPNVPPFK